MSLFAAFLYFFICCIRCFVHILNLRTTCCLIAFFCLQIYCVIVYFQRILSMRSVANCLCDTLPLCSLIFVFIYPPELEFTISDFSWSKSLSKVCLLGYVISLVYLVFIYYYFNRIIWLVFQSIIKIGVDSGLTFLWNLNMNNYKIALLTVWLRPG